MALCPHLYNAHMTDVSSRKPAEISRDALVRWLGDYLKIDAYPDPGMNGLQIEGTGTITRVAASVDTSAKTLQHAADSGADLLLVHHGLFWVIRWPSPGRTAPACRRRWQRT